MIVKVKVFTFYKSTLERAFKTPMLCDVSKIHTGYGIMPKVTHTKDDQDWGKPGSSKKIFVANSPTQKGGFASMDHILERKENDYWIIQVDTFQSWMLGFHKFVGEWKTTQIEDQKILVEYTYKLHVKNILLFPLCWIFGKTFMKIYMKRVLENVRLLIQKEEPYLHN